MTYQICSNCVMDTTDPHIYFDGDGVCNHCHDTKRKIDQQYHPDLFDAIINTLDEMSAADDIVYDCLLPLSGGIDSSYCAYLLDEYEINPLCWHLDNYYNTEIATRNIAKIIEKTGWDIIYHQVEKTEFTALQHAFMSAGVMDLELITDHVLLAGRWQKASQHQLKTIIVGRNIITEGVLPTAWRWNKHDDNQLYNIAKEYDLPLYYTDTIDDKELKYYQEIERIYEINLLNYVPYDRTQVIQDLISKFDYEVYGDKHCESIFTRYFQRVILPVRWGIDKRRAHYSSLIISEQMNRGLALDILKIPPNEYPEVREDVMFICATMNITPEHLAFLISDETPKRSHKEFV